MSVGGGLLSFPQWVLLLLHCNALGVGPKHVASESVAPCGFDLVLGFFIGAGCAVVVEPDWMKTMQAAISTHVLEFCHLGAPAATSAVTAVGIDVLIVELGGHAGDGGGEFLNLRLHCCQLFVV